MRSAPKGYISPCRMILPDGSLIFNRYFLFLLFPYFFVQKYVKTPNYHLYNMNYFNVTKSRDAPPPIRPGFKPCADLPCLRRRGPLCPNAAKRRILANCLPRRCALAVRPAMPPTILFSLSTVHAIFHNVARKAITASLCHLDFVRIFRQNRKRSAGKRLFHGKTAVPGHKKRCCFHAKSMLFHSRGLPAHLEHGFPCIWNIGSRISGT